MTRAARGPSVVLLSGGMDSGTCLAIASKEAAPVHALTVRYGQRHSRELTSARRLANHFAVASHTVLALPLAPILESALTDPRRDLPRRAPRAGTIPSTYVPARNTILLSLALGLAESRGARSIYIGANAIDYSGYPDCRPEFLHAFEALARKATKAGVERGEAPRIRAPLLRLTKRQVVELGDRLKVPWSDTWSCYAGGRRPCGRCDACRWREKGFREAGVADPLSSAAPSAGRPTYRRSSASRRAGSR